MALNGIAHKNLTDPQLHEPKGASTATLNQVPFADGEGGTVWGEITPDKLVIIASLVSQASSNTATIPTALDVLGLSATTTGVCSDAANFTQANKNTKEVAVLVNSLITTVTSLKSSYNDLATKYNALLTVLKNLGFITTGV